jgi:hypothetical protein
MDGFGGEDELVSYPGTGFNSTSGDIKDAGRV